MRPSPARRLERCARPAVPRPLPGDVRRRGLACAPAFRPPHVSTAGGQRRDLNFARRLGGSPSRFLPPPTMRPGPPATDSEPRRRHRAGSPRSGLQGPARVASAESFGLGVLQELPGGLSVSPPLGPHGLPNWNHRLHPFRSASPTGTKLKKLESPIFSASRPHPAPNFPHRYLGLSSDCPPRREFC